MDNKAQGLIVANSRHIYLCVYIQTYQLDKLKNPGMANICLWLHQEDSA